MIMATMTHGDGRGCDVGENKSESLLSSTLYLSMVVKDDASHAVDKDTRYNIMMYCNEQKDIDRKEGGQTSISRQQTLLYRQHRRTEHPADPAARVCRTDLQIL